MDRIFATEISIQQKYAKISPIKCSASDSAKAQTATTCHIISLP